MSALGRLALICLARARHSPDLLGELGRYLSLVREVVEAPNGIAALTAIVSYILEVTDLPPRHVEDFFRQLGPGAEEAYMTGAEQLIEQVRRETAERVQRETAERVQRETRRETLVQILTEQVKQLFAPVPAERFRQIERASVEELERWTKRIVSAKTLDEALSTELH